MVVLWDTPIVEWHATPASPFDVRAPIEPAAASVPDLETTADRPRRGVAGPSPAASLRRHPRPLRRRHDAVVTAAIAATPSPHGRYYPALEAGATHLVVDRASAADVVGVALRDDAAASALRRGAAAVDRDYVSADAIAAHLATVTAALRDRAGFALVEAELLRLFEANDACDAFVLVQIDEKRRAKPGGSVCDALREAL